MVRNVSIRGAKKESLGVKQPTLKAIEEVGG